VPVDLGESPEIIFTLAGGQNQFFVELAEALAYELRALGASATLKESEIPLPRKGRVHVFLPPHEYVSLSRYRPPDPLLRRSIVVSAEQPETHFFEANLPLAREAGAVFDINPRSVRAYRSNGIEASLLRLGHTELWDRFGDRSGARGVERDIDVLFLGRLSPRRSFAIASYADVLERFRCHIGLSDNSRPNVAGGAAFVAGDQKRDLLARSKVLLNVHGEEEPYFEWLRIAEAICAGCAVVSEHSSDVAPLTWGQHVITGELGSLGLFCAWLAEDDAERDRIRTGAYELMRTQRRLADAAAALLQAARAVDSEPVGVDLELACRQERARRRFRENPPSLEHQPPERADFSDGETLMLRGLKQQLLAVSALRRQLARAEHVLCDPRREEPRTRVIAESAAWPERRGALSVIVPLFNHRDDVISALCSLERSSWTDWEVVVVDDASTDGGGGTVEAWLLDHPKLAGQLVRHDVNQGLAAARNTGIEYARADRLLMLDADNELRAIAMGRLTGALDASPDASFAYGIMERFSADGSQGLLSTFPWDPSRLRASNYIDAFSLIRREAIEAMDGYSYDPRLYGWEDYDLWVRMAEAGRFAVFVPEVIARYRVGHSSMISQTNLSTADAYAALVDHAPKLMAGLEIPR
jgi:Glycosyl transferase family 2